MWITKTCVVVIDFGIKQDKKHYLGTKVEP